VLACDILLKSLISVRVIKQAIAELIGIASRTIAAQFEMAYNVLFFKHFLCEESENSDCCKDIEMER